MSRNRVIVVIIPAKTPTTQSFVKFSGATQLPDAAVGAMHVVGKPPADHQYPPIPWEANTLRHMISTTL